MGPSPLADTTNTRLQPDGTEAQNRASEITDSIAAKLSSLPGVSKRKNASEDDTPQVPDHNKTYYELGRLFGRISDPFADVSHVVAMGIKNDTADTDEEAENQNAVFKNPVNKHALDTWKLWTDKYPCFRKDILSAQECPAGQSVALVKRINNKVAEGINAIRAVDTSSLKTNILNYLLENPTDIITPAICAKDKSDRGWNHPVTAKLLCPVAWEANNETYTAIREGRKKLTADYFPRFLYPSNQVYNPNDLEDGLLRGFLLFRVAKHILMGPSAALERPGYHRGKRSNAQINGITSVTPELVAYIAVQIWHALASQLNWSAADVTFNYPLFFWNIVHIFDDNEGEEILKVFDYQVFGPRNEMEEEDDTPPELEQIKAVRARKRARMGNSEALPTGTA